MNGTTAELWAKITNRLKSTNIMMMGASQKRLRTLRKSQSSLNMDNFDIALLR
jgi:hypothetical protein